MATINQRLSYGLRSSHWISGPPQYGKANQLLKKEVVTNLTTEKSGASEPDWKRLVLQHKNATTPYVRTWYEVKEVVPFRGMITGLYPYTTRTVQTVGPLFAPRNLAGYATGFPEHVRNHARVAFVKAANKRVRTSQLWVTLGEVRETIRMIRNPISALRKGFDDYSKAVVVNSRQRVNNRRRSNKRLTIGGRRKAVAEAIAGTYLEYSNGWKPFIGDLHASLQTVANLREQATDYFENVVGYAAEVSPWQHPVSTTGPVTLSDTFGIRAAEKLYGERTDSVRIKGQIKVTVDAPATDRIRQVAGFSFAGFVPAMWELLPLSYVVDTFVNIGDVLDTWTFDNSTLAWACQTERTRLKAKHFGDSFAPDSPGTKSLVVQQAGVVKLEYTRLNRRERQAALNLRVYPRFKRLLPNGQFARLCNFSSLLVSFRSSSQSLWTLVQ